MTKDSSETKKSSCKKCGKLRKILRWTALSVVILLAIVLIAVCVVINRLNPIVKGTLETYAPKLLGAPVTVEKVDFSILRMRFELDGMVVGNPEGYKTDSAIELGKVLVKVNPFSLFSDTIEVQQILVQDPVITYEVGLGNSNIGTLLANVNAATAAVESASAKPEKVEESAASSEGGKKVVINEVRVAGGQIRLSAKVLQGLAAPIPLPTIALHDIGKEKQGASVLEATNEVLTSVFGSIIDVGKSGLSALTDGAKAVGKAAEDSAKAVGKAAEDSVKAVGKAAEDSAKAVGDAAGKALGTVKGIFGGNKKKDK